MTRIVPPAGRNAPAGLWAARLTWGLGALVLGYIVFRAFSLSMTCDEAWSAQGLPHPSLFAFVTPAFIAALNNHFLNSWLMNLSLTVFGPSDWAARLPALCGGAAYVVLACRLALTQATSWRALALAVLLLGNPYLLDFLSIARGYSLGLAFLLPGLTRLVSGRERGRAWCLAWFALAVLSNLSFVYAYLTALALVWGECVLRRGRGWKEAAASSLTTLAVLAAVYARALILATANNEHWWGSQAGFVDGTLASLLAMTLYEPHLDPGVFVVMARVTAGLVLLAAATGCLLAAGTAPGGQAGRAAEDDDARPFFAMLVFLGVCWAGITAEHLLFGTPYLIERGALFLYPLLCLVVGLWAEYARGRGWVAGLSGAALAAIAGLCLANLTANANLSHVSTWRADACARSFMTRIHEENFQRNFTREPVRLASLATHVHTVNYYVGRLGMGYVTEILPRERATEADYLVVGKDQADAFIGRNGLEVLLRCEAGGVVLLRRPRGPLSGK